MIRNCSDPAVLAEEPKWQEARLREIQSNPKSLKLYRSIYTWYELAVVATSWEEAKPMIRELVIKAMAEGRTIPWP